MGSLEKINLKCRGAPLTERLPQDVTRALVGRDIQHPSWIACRLVYQEIDDRHSVLGAVFFLKEEESACMAYQCFGSAAVSAGPVGYRRALQCLSQ